MLARLIWSPRALGAAAALCSTPVALAIGGLSAASQLAMIGATVVGGIDEPFSQLSVYFYGAVRAAVLLHVLTVPIVLAVAGLVSLVVQESLGDRRKRAARVRVVYLSPLTLWFPILLWSIAGALKSAQDPAFGLGSGKPDWIMSPVIAVAGSCLWLPVGLFLLGLNVRRGLREIPRLMPGAARPLCMTCGYDLTGNVSGICPECGTLIVKGRLGPRSQ